MRSALARALAALRPSVGPTVSRFNSPFNAPFNIPAGSASAVPTDAVSRTAARCRKRVTQRALLAAGVAMVPLPGVDLITDIGVLVKLLPEITTAFGLSPAQVERLAPARRVVVYKAISAGSSMVLGRIVTRELVMVVLKTVGLRLSTQQAAKYLPVAGQVISAALTFSALKYVCEQHIRQCEAVARQLLLSAPEPAPG